MSDEVVAQFISFTGASSDEAKHYLEMSGGELQQAVTLFLDMGGGGGGAPGSPQRPPVAPPTSNPPGVSDDVVDEVRAAAIAAGLDLQDVPMEEPPEVRAPIAAYQDQMIDPNNERRRMQDAIQADSVAMHKRMSFDRPVDQPGAGSGDTKMQDISVGETTQAQGQAINQLFAPPDFNETDSYYNVIEKAKTEKKWVLVNIQQAEVFASHQLNRDVWRDETIQDVVLGSFLFWQRDDKSTEGVQFCQYYNCGHQLPHICVIDPRTGRRAKHWDGRKWADAHSAAEFLFAFLDQFSLSSPPVESPKPSPGMQPHPAPNTGSADDMALTGLDDNTGMDVSDKTKERGRSDSSVMDTAPPAEPPAEMPVEPEDSAECLKVQLRFPSGEKITRRFLSSAPVAEMFAVASAKSGAPVSKVDLSTTFPKRSLRDIEGGLESLLKDAQVAGSQIMVSVKA